MLHISICKVKNAKTYASVHMASAVVHHTVLLHFLVVPADRSLKHLAAHTDLGHMDTASVHSPVHNPVTREKSAATHNGEQSHQYCKSKSIRNLSSCVKSYQIHSFCCTVSLALAKSDIHI